MAEIIGVSLPTFTKWLDEGMPFAVQGSKGKDWVFETAEVIAWYAGNKFDKRDGRASQGAGAKTNPFEEPQDGLETEDEAKARKERALADKHEISVAKDAGLLVPVDDVKAIVMEEGVRVKARILSIPNAIRPLLLTHLKNDRKATEQVVSLVEGTIFEALEEIKYMAEEDDLGRPE